MKFPSTLIWVVMFFGATGCFNQSQEEVQTSAQAPSKEENTECPLAPGKYDVQSLTFQSNAGTYNIFVVGAQSCVRQPVSMAAVRLARIETSGSTSPKAQLEVTSTEDPTLYLTEDYKIEMRSAVIEGEQIVKEETSSWMPFLAGAAGAAVAGMAMNAMFNKPNYYQPPPPRPGMADVRGYGSVAPNYKDSVSNYQSKYNSLPASEQPQNKSFFSRKNASGNAINDPRQNQASAAKPGSQSVQDSRNNSNPTSAKPQRKGFFSKRRR